MALASASRITPTRMPGRRDPHVLRAEGRPLNPNVDRLIRESIDAHLAHKGYERVSESGKPDFWVDYAVGVTLRGSQRVV